jgi:hypothetical protein
MPAASGTWSDSGGQSGNFVLGGNGAGSGPRLAVAAAAGPPGPARSRRGWSPGRQDPLARQARLAPGAARPRPQGASGLRPWPAGRLGRTQLQGFTADGHALCATAGTGADLTCSEFSSSGIQGWLTSNSRTLTSPSCSSAAYGYILDVQTSAGEFIRFEADFPGTGGGDLARVSCSNFGGPPCPGFPTSQQFGASAVTLVACRQEVFAFAAAAGITCP